MYRTTPNVHETEKEPSCEYQWRDFSGPEKI